MFEMDLDMFHIPSFERSIMRLVKMDENGYYSAGEDNGLCH